MGLGVDDDNEPAPGNVLQENKNVERTDAGFPLVRCGDGQGFEIERRKEACRSKYS